MSTVSTFAQSTWRSPRFFSAPTLKRGTARQHHLDNAHVVPGRAAHHHAVAHRRQQTVIFFLVLFGKPHSMFRAEAIVCRHHQRKPTV